MTVSKKPRLVKRRRARLRPNGYVLWRGPSAHDGKPITVIATGFIHASSNPKTGPMTQVFVIRSDISPVDATATGEDKSVCNNCELRKFTVKQLGLPIGGKPPMCYVGEHASVLQVYNSLKRGTYGKTTKSSLADLFDGRIVRFGAYGNLSNAPLWVVEQSAKLSKGWTMYEHDWRAERAQPLKRFAMASVSSEASKAEANAMGWRTYRVKRSHEPVLSDEIVCPASDEAGHKTTCDRCLLCNGTSRKARNIVINDHGATSPEHQAKVHQVMVELGLRKAKI